MIGSIGPGLCVLVGVTHGDDAAAAERMAQKLWNLRVFEDEAGRTNRSAAELQAPLLVVSQFTLYADT
ncbi:MAG: D-aminoacyl-tRNA deacylase, partial [Acidimicrobiales bacterium]